MRRRKQRSGRYDREPDNRDKPVGGLPRSGKRCAIGKSSAAYFAMINDQGGINGRKVDFISRDDGYSPPKTVELVREMVEQDQVLLLFEPLGTAPNSAIQAT